MDEKAAGSEKPQEHQVQPASSVLKFQSLPPPETQSISEIQGQAQRVCSVLSGDAKRHLMLLKRLNSTNVVVQDVKKAISEANMWLAECISPSNCADDDACVREVKINQQIHAEKCLLDANQMAINEINRLSDKATSNTTEAQAD